MIGPAAQAAIAAHRRGSVREALSLYSAALRDEPRDPELHRLAGVAALAVGELGKAIRYLREAVALAPDDAIAHGNLAAALRRTTDLAGALEHARAAVGLRADLATLWLGLGNSAAELGRYGEAEQAFVETLAREPDHRGARIGLGHVLRAMGRGDAAETAYRQCLERWPDWGEAWWSLANIKTVPMTATDRATLQGVIGDIAVPREQAAGLYALGKAFDDNDEADRAFDAYARGAALMRRLAPFDRETATATLRQHAEGMDRAFFDERADWGLDAAPIFIVGFPRAGSTLIEQLLSCVPGIEGVGELPYLPELAFRAPLLRDLTREDCRALGCHYLGLARHHQASDARLIDKLPNNFEHLGLARLLFPKAIFIDARRDPMATCTGCFRQYFPAGQEFTYDLTDLGRWYRAYDRMMAHWAACFGEAIVRVDYERLVTDFDAEARHLVARCGLDWHPDVLTFHRNARPVRTASADQVREPVHTRAVDAWRRYGARLNPLRAALRDLV